MTSSPDAETLVVDNILDVLVPRAPISTYEPVVPTLHNYVELVYRLFGAPFPAAANRVALLGVREAFLTSGAGREGVSSPPGEIAKLETRSESDLEMAPETRAADATLTPTTYNDLLHAVWTPNVAAHEQSYATLQCTLDKSPLDDSGGAGGPILCEGIPYEVDFWAHKDYASAPRDAKDSAVRIWSLGASTVRLARDADLAHRVLSGLSCAFVTRNAATGTRTRDAALLPPQEYWRFCREEINDTIHIHGAGRNDGREDIGGAGDVGDWSTGCVVVRHSFESARYRRFLDILHRSSDAPPQDPPAAAAVDGAALDATPSGAPAQVAPAAPAPRVAPFLVVSSQYVLLYDEWRAAIAESVRQSPPTDPPPWRDPASVLRAGALRKLPERSGSYLPSFVGDDFVNAVRELVDQLRRCAEACVSELDDANLTRYVAPVSFYAPFMPNLPWEDVLPTHLRAPGKLTFPRGNAFALELDAPRPEYREAAPSRRLAARAHVAASCSALATNLERSLEACSFRLTISVP